QPWLADPGMTLPTLIFVDVWEFTPMVAIILLAGLSTLPDEPDEAARIDGAGLWQRFWYVTLPMLKPVVLVAVLLRAIDALKTFDLLYVTKGQGGGSFHEAETLNIYVYGLSFKYNDFGVASAVLIIFFLMILAVMWLLTFRREVPSCEHHPDRHRRAGRHRGPARAPAPLTAREGLQRVPGHDDRVRGAGVRGAAAVDGDGLVQDQRGHPEHRQDVLLHPDPGQLPARAGQRQLPRLRPEQLRGGVPGHRYLPAPGGAGGLLDEPV